MKITRKFIFRAVAVVLLLVIAVGMAIIGRGHNIYFDNKTYEANGVKIETPYKIEVKVKGNDTQKLYTRERGEAKILGQTLKLNLEITEKKGGAEREESYKIVIPYSLDGAVINLPALLKGLSPDEYMTEFVSLATSSSDKEETVVTDEFSMGEF